jgi:hypothetical protein
MSITSYSLDLAFSSAIPIGNNPVDTFMYALGWGWVKNETEGSKETAQKTEKVAKGMPINFSIYDGGSLTNPAQKITNFRIIFNHVNGPVPASTPQDPTPSIPTTPFLLDEYPVTNPINISSGIPPFTTTPFPSIGCNINGYVCTILPNSYTINDSVLPGTVYSFSVEITVLPGDGPPKTFRVDPKMIVGQG